MADRRVLAVRCLVISFPESINQQLIKKYMTQEELKWCKSLRKIIKSMPDTLELVIGCGSASVLEAGSVQKNLDIQGHQDNPEQFSEKQFFFQFNGGVYGSESQI